MGMRTFPEIQGDLKGDIGKQFSNRGFFLNGFLGELEVSFKGEGFSSSDFSSFGVTLASVFGIKCGVSQTFSEIWRGLTVGYTFFGVGIVEDWNSFLGVFPYGFNRDGDSS